MDDSAMAGRACGVDADDARALLVSLRDEWTGEVAHALSLAGWRSQSVSSASEAEWQVKSRAPALILIDFERIDAFCPLLIAELSRIAPDAVIVTVGGYALTAFKTQMEMAGAADVYDGPPDVTALLQWLAGTALPLTDAVTPMVHQAVSHL